MCCARFSRSQRKTYHIIMPVDTNLSQERSGERETRLYYDIIQYKGSSISIWQSKSVSRSTLMYVIITNTAVLYNFQI